MAILDGKANKHGSTHGSSMRGGNVQREKFASESSSKSKGEDKPETKVKGPAEGEESSTTITHHADGTHTAEHSDGEKSEHPNLGHLAMHMHGKHEGGMAMHAHEHDGGVTTHHVGMDGMVEGPHDHASADEAGEHMKQVLGSDGGNGAMNMSDGMEPKGSMPSLY